MKTFLFTILFIMKTLEETLRAFVDKTPYKWRLLYDLEAKLREDNSDYGKFLREIDRISSLIVQATNEKEVEFAKKELETMVETMDVEYHPDVYKLNNLITRKIVKFRREFVLSDKLFLTEKRKFIFKVKTHCERRSATRYKIYVDFFIFNFQIFSIMYSLNSNGDLYSLWINKDEIDKVKII